jgi:hypothetical protein
MARLRSKFLLAALLIVAALIAAFVAKNESAVLAQKSSPIVSKEADGPHEIELEQNAELLRASKVAR